MPDPRQLREDEPKRVGSYRLTGYLGGGSHGTVYLGTNTSGQTVAVKVLHRWLIGDNAARRRFVEEMSIARRVADSYVTRVFDVGLDLDLPFVVSEYAPGESLHAVVAQHGPLDPGAAVRLALGTATGLAAIHRAGIAHRDFKPHNVLLGGDRPRVIDFGLAHALGASVTGPGIVVGTPFYAAPEQLAGQDAVPASDVFAWAGTMVFAATGRPAFGDDHVSAVLWRIANAEPALSGMPDRLVPLLSACLDKDPGRRPSADELVSALMERDTPADRPEPDVIAPAPGPVRVRPPVEAAPTRTVPAATVTDRLASGPLPDLSKPVPGEDEWIQRPRRRALPLGIAASGAAAAVAAALLFALWPSGQEVDTAQRTRNAQSSGRLLNVPAVGAAMGQPLTVGSPGSVSAVAEPALNGKPVLVAGGQDGDLRVFDRSTGRPIGAPLTGHKGKVTALAVGTLNAKPVVVSGGADHTIRVWDIAAGHEIGAPFTGDTDAITSLATATVGGRSVVLSGSTDWSVRRWDMATGRQIGPPILGHESPVTTVTAATLNGQPVVVAGCAGKMVRAWDITSGKEIGMGFMGHTSALTSLTAATLNGKPVVVSSDTGGTIKVSDLATGDAKGPAFPHRPTVTAMATTNVNGHAAVLTGEGDTVHLWDLETRKEIIPALTGPTRPVIWVTADTVDGVPVAVAGSADGTVRMWRIR